MPDLWFKCVQQQLPVLVVPGGHEPGVGIHTGGTDTVIVLDVTCVSCDEQLGQFKSLTADKAQEDLTIIVEDEMEV